MSLAEKWIEFRRKNYDQNGYWADEKEKRAFYAGAEAALNTLPNDVPLGIVGQHRLLTMRTEIDRFKGQK